MKSKFNMIYLIIILLVIILMMTSCNNACLSVPTKAPVGSSICTSAINTGGKTDMSEFSLVIPENASVTMSIGGYTDGELQVTSNLIKKINNILVLASSNIWHKDNPDIDEGVVKLIIKFDGKESVLIFDEMFRNVTKCDGKWYEFPVINDKFFIGKVSNSGNYVYDSVSEIVLQQQNADIDKDGIPEDIRLVYNGKWSFYINKCNYSFSDVLSILEQTNVFLNPNLYPGCDPKARFAVVTLEDTKQPAVITYFLYRARYKGDGHKSYSSYEDMNLFTFDNKKLQCKLTHVRDNLIGTEVNTVVKNKKVWVEIPSIEYSFMLPPENYQQQYHSNTDKSIYQRFVELVKSRTTKDDPVFYIFQRGEAEFKDIDKDGLLELCTGAPLICSSFPEASNLIAFCDTQFDITSKGFKLKSCKMTPCRFDN